MVGTNNYRGFLDQIGMAPSWPAPTTFQTQAALNPGAQIPLSPLTAKYGGPAPSVAPAPSIDWSKRLSGLAGGLSAAAKIAGQPPRLRPTISPRFLRLIGAPPISPFPTQTSVLYGGSLR